MNCLLNLGLVIEVKEVYACSLRNGRIKDRHGIRICYGHCVTEATAIDVTSRLVASDS